MFVSPPGPVVDEARVRAALYDVIDPELGVNIVDLGLVYGVSVNEANDVLVRMTLTTPGCPLGGYIDDEIQRCLGDLDGIGDIRVQLVWEPPWHPSQMTAEGRAQLGWQP